MRRPRVGGHGFRKRLVDLGQRVADKQHPEPLGTAMAKLCLPRNAFGDNTLKYPPLPARPLVRHLLIHSGDDAIGEGYVAADQTARQFVRENLVGRQTPTRKISRTSFGRLPAIDPSNLSNRLRLA